MSKEYQTSVEPRFDLFYRLDKQDRIIQIGGTWDQFAEGNGGSALREQNVVGRSLYDFVWGDVSKMFVRTLFDGVRILQCPRTAPYRCDSPGLKRFMEMDLILEGGGELLVGHRQLRVEPVMRHFEFMPGTSANSRISIRCTHCNALKLNGSWGEAETVLPVSAEGRIPVIYGVCPACLQQVRRR